MEQRISETNQWIRNRRSSFFGQFIPRKKIPDEVVEAILENANHAPTHKRTEPWRFTVFTDKGLETLAAAQAAIYKENAGENFKQAAYDKLLSNPLKCSHVIAIGMKREGSIPESEEIAAVACAVQNIYLSLDAYGIGGFWGTGGITYMEAGKEWLGLNREDRLMGFFYLGYIQIPSTARTPGPMSEKTRWVTS